MGMFILGLVCMFGSVGGLECGCSVFAFIITVIIGILCLVRGIQKMFG